MFQQFFQGARGGRSVPASGEYQPEELRSVPRPRGNMSSEPRLQGVDLGARLRRFTEGEASPDASTPLDLEVFNIRNLEDARVHLQQGVRALLDDSPEGRAHEVRESVHTDFDRRVSERLNLGQHFLYVVQQTWAQLCVVAGEVTEVAPQEGLFWAHAVNTAFHKRHSRLTRTLAEPTKDWAAIRADLARRVAPLRVVVQDGGGSGQKFRPGRGFDRGGPSFNASSSSGKSGGGGRGSGGPAGAAAASQPRH